MKQKLEKMRNEDRARIVLEGSAWLVRCLSRRRKGRWGEISHTDENLSDARLDILDILLSFGTKNRTAFLYYIFFPYLYSWNYLICKTLLLVDNLSLLRYMWSVRTDTKTLSNTSILSLPTYLKVQSMRDLQQMYIEKGTYKMQAIHICASPYSF